MSMNSLFTNSNFFFRHEYRDQAFPNKQMNWKRIGDVGTESDEFKERAYKQFHMQSYEDLAKNQDSFVAEDPTAGTSGREKNRNYNKMEYDIPERTDGKGSDQVIKEANAKTEMTVKNILNAFKNQGWTLNNTASTVSNEPIEKSDYDDQMTTDK